MAILVDIEKKIGKFHLKVAFEAENEVLSLLGASGCGKSMTLRCIAGVMKPDRGRIVLDDVTLFDSEKKINLPPQKRRIGFLFQNYALFPNMTVRDNLRAGCRRSLKGEEREKRIRKMTEMFELSELLEQLPSQLSGGQQQRTALARILLSEPEILLLDEPFSALDAHLRFRLEREMMEVIKEFGKTVILVSHNRDEVFRMSNKIAVMERGVIQVQGSREQVFKNPTTRQAAVLTGCKNVAACEVLSESRVRIPEWGFELEIGKQREMPAHIGIRMHHILPGEGENTLNCHVVSEIENPFSFVVMIRPEDQPQANPIGWEMEKEVWRNLRAEQVIVHIPSEAILCLKETKKFK